MKARRALVAFGILACFGVASAALASCVGDDPVVASAATADDAASANETGVVTDASNGVDGAEADAGDAADATPVCDASPCVVQVSTGGAHSCVRLLDGTVRCWGANGFGESGNGTVIPSDGGLNVDDTVSPNTYAAPTAVAGIKGAVVVGTGGSYRASGVSCAGTGDGKMSCWGIDSWLELGRGGTAGQEVVPRPARPVPEAVVSISNVVDISVGVNHVCAVIKLGSVACWGSDLLGQLGFPQSSPESRWGTPVVLASAPSFLHIATRGHHNIALAANGDVWGWGGNLNAQLGVAASTTETPKKIAALTGKYVGLAAGRFHSCALDETGKVYCWGGGSQGQLGRNVGVRPTGDPVPALIKLDAGKIVTQIAGDEQHMLALLDDGTVYEWGNLLALSGGTGIDVPTLVALPNRATQVAAGFEHSCVLLEGGAVWCWGNNASGELGRGAGAGPQGLTPAPVVF